MSEDMKDVMKKGENKRISVEAKKRWLMFGTIVVVIAAVLIGIGVAQSPERRLQEHLDLGQKYLEEQNYEQAIVEFGKAIEIDPACAEAYLGTATAYEGQDNYTNAVEILEVGYEKTGENPNVKDKMIEDYLYLAENHIEEGEYEESLEIFDRLMELDGENQQILDALKRCLDGYIESLLEKEQYDEIRALIEKYGNRALGVDFQGILDGIEENEQKAMEREAFMQKVYTLMVAENYDEMHLVDGSEEARVFVEEMTEDHYIYFPEENASMTGTGAGVYKFGERGYYFFYGEYKDGIRAGNGVSFCNSTSGGYGIFSGSWDQDAPNGQGESIFIGRSRGSGTEYQKITSGNYVNGLCHGRMECSTIVSGIAYDMPFIASNGIPEDKTEEYLNRGIWGGRILDLGRGRICLCL